MNKEIWKDIKGYEGKYQVSNMGRVRCLKYKKGNKTVVLTPDTSSQYKRQTLSLNSKTKKHSIHRLVADAFIENKYNKPQVNHINGIKDDNRADNLEWCTVSENVKHAFDNGLINTMKGINHFGVKSVAMIDKTTNNIINSFFSVTEASKQTGFNRAGIANCCRGISKTSNGYLWKYL